MSSNTAAPGHAQGRALAAAGAYWGLGAALVLGGVRAFNTGAPYLQVELFGTVVFTAMYAMPFAIALGVSRIGDRGVRGALLAPLALVSTVAVISTLSGVAILLLPSAVLLWMAAFVALRRSSHRLLDIALVGVGLIGFLTIVLSFLALFVLSDDQTRCWALVTTESGNQRWTQVQPGGSPGTLGVSLGPGGSQASCTSDVITNAEGLVALLVLLMAPVVLSAAYWLARRVGGPAAIDTT